MVKRIFAILIMLAILDALAGCNTMHGLGQDIERGGENLQKKSDDAKRN